MKEAIESAYHCHSESMAAFLCFLAIRLREMHRILKPTGSLFIHCDDTASHYIKAVLDAVFGASNFRNEIIWRRAKAKGNAVKANARNHDIIFYYAKSAAANYKPQYREHDERYLRAYSKVEESTGRRYQLVAINAPKQDPKSALHYEVMGVTRTWRWTKERMKQAIKEGRVVQSSPGAVPRQVMYLDEQNGPAVDSIWDDIGPLQGSSSERIGYPTQKPLALYRRIIRSASNEGDVVLDPFCGCATTCVAAEQTGRHWLGMDLWPKAGEVILDRVQRECDHLEGGEITTLGEPPVRTDKGEVAGSSKCLARMKGEGETKISINRAAALLELTSGGDHCQCAGCERLFDSPDYLELDHRDPKSDGGSDALHNRIPLCKPCNGLKSNRLTLSGLQDAIIKAAKNPRDKRHKWAAASPLAERKIGRKIV